MSRKSAGVDFDGNPFEGRAGLERRRAIVLDLKLRGMGHRAIAAILKVHRNTVSNDFRAIRRMQAEMARSLDGDAEVGATVSYYEKLRNTAFKEYMEAKSNQAKLGYLQTALRAQEMHVKLLMDIGIIDRTPVRGKTTHSGTIKLDVEQLSKLPKADLEAKADELRSRYGVPSSSRIGKN